VRRHRPGPAAPRRPGPARRGPRRRPGGARHQAPRRAADAAALARRPAPLRHELAAGVLGRAVLPRDRPAGLAHGAARRRRGGRRAQPGRGLLRRLRRRAGRSRAGARDALPGRRRHVGHLGVRVSAPAGWGAARAAARGGRAAVRAALAAAAAWGLLLLVAGSPLAWALGHDALSLAAVPLAAAVPAYAAGWTLMVAAMMLPGALALAPPTRLSGWLAGYLGAWALAGFAFAGLDLVLHATLPDGGPAAAALPPLTLAIAATWLAAVSRGAGRPGRPHLRGSDAGWLHGLACLRTCWPAMLALQAAFPGDLGAMAAAGALLTALRVGAAREGRAGPARGRHGVASAPSRRAQAAPLAAGNVMRTVAPPSPPSSRSASWAAATARTTRSPRPSAISAGKPGPVSDTSRKAAPSRVPVRIVTPPRLVALIALWRRLSSAWASRRGSARVTAGEELT